MRLRDAWYAGETGLWEDEKPQPEGDFTWSQGPGGTFFALYESRGTLGSFKPHFWAGQRGESLRDHTDPQVCAGPEGLLLGLIWDGTDGEAPHTGPGFFCDDPKVSYGVPLARSPENVRELAATWERAEPSLGGPRPVFAEHAAVPGGWVGEFGEFTALLEDWGRVLAEAARRGWGVVALSQ